MGCGSSKEVNDDRDRYPKLDITSGNPALSPADSGGPVEAKLVLLGDSGVGKSSLALRFCQGRFSDYHEVTIGAAFLQQTVRTRDGSSVKLHIWDTGGQERFRAMAPLYYRDASAAIVAYDITNPQSFKSVQYWVRELRNKGKENVVIAIAGNKADKAETAGERKVELKAAKDYAEENGMIFMETSAKTSTGVNKLFEQIAQQVYNQETKGRTPKR
eukprot:GILJ01004625.1.p1 GENE.GILJ01004625.1~~GILJ01004625.1.p1  ORF type:complete len:216 (-),score=34.33 GILJ01004625.1:143-790(-)